MPEPWSPWRDKHGIDDFCNKDWCRLHYWPGYGNHEAYAHSVNIRHGINGVESWERVMVFCGPGAYLPKKPKDR